MSVLGPAILTFLIFLTVSWLVVRILSPDTVRQLLLQVGATCLVLTSLTTVYTEEPGTAIATGVGSAVLVYAILRMSRGRTLGGQEEDPEALSLHDALMPEAGTDPGSPRATPPAAPPVLPPLFAGAPPRLDEEGGQAEPLPGMRAAGWILLANAAASTAIATLNAAAEDEGGSRALLAIAIADLVIGAGLLSGGRVWSRWATGRAIVTALLFGLLLPIAEGTGPGWAGAVPQIVLSIGIIYLVRLRGTDRRRLSLGVLAVALAWSGALAGSVAPGVLSLQTGGRTGPSAPGDLFRDAALGLRLDLPPGWLLLPASRLAGSLPGTRLMAVHPRSGSTAVLVVESGVSAPSLDAYLDRVLQEHRKKTASIIDLGRIGAQLGGHEARRMLVRWQEDAAPVVGVITVCREDTRHYRLESWGPDVMSSIGFRASQDLARGLVILPGGEDRPEATALRLMDRMPNFTLEGARLLVEEMQRRHLAAADAQRFTGEALRIGLGLLRPPEKSEWDRLTKVHPTNLSPASQRRLRSLGDKAIVAALRQGKAAEQGRRVGRAEAPGPAVPSPTVPARR